MNAAPELDRTAFPFRMKDLCEQTGVPRQVIHFYIAQGLLPEGHKTGRNMAYYGPQHVERVKAIRQLQHERFLPLKAIKALFDAREDAFTAPQRRLLLDVKTRLEPILGKPPSRGAAVDVAPLLLRTGTSRDDLARFVELGILGVSEDEAGRTLIAEDDAWMLELWGELRLAGFTRERGFTADDLAIYEEMIATLFARETELLTRRLAHLPPDEVAAMVTHALPLINTFLSRYHMTKARNFFAAM